MLGVLVVFGLFMIDLYLLVFLSVVCDFGVSDVVV